MHLVSMVAELDLVSGDRTSALQESIYAHAAIVRQVSALNPELGRQIHDAGNNRGFTLSMLGTLQNRGALRMTFFGDKGFPLAETVADCLNRNPRMSLGHAEWALARVKLSDSEWAGFASWDDILRGANSRRIRFHFVTPTAFSRTNGDGARFTDVLPEPERVFGTLARRWSGLASIELPPGFDAWLNSGGCVVSDHRLRTVTARLTERTQIGFIGNVTYECLDQTAHFVAAVNNLARLAFFVGVGYQTARGMGTVRTEAF